MRPIALRTTWVLIDFCKHKMGAWMGGGTMQRDGCMCMRMLSAATLWEPCDSMPQGAVVVWLDFLRMHPAGLDIYCCTLASNFKAPLIREYCLLLGLRSCERSAIRNMLSCGPGKSVMLAVGGAAESLLAAPGTCDLVRALPCLPACGIGCIPLTCACAACLCTVSVR